MVAVPQDLLAVPVVVVVVVVAEPRTTTVAVPRPRAKGSGNGRQRQGRLARARDLVAVPQDLLAVIHVARARLPRAMVVAEPRDLLAVPEARVLVAVPRTQATCLQIASSMPFGPSPWPGIRGRDSRIFRIQ